MPVQWCPRDQPPINTLDTESLPGFPGDIPQEPSEFRASRPAPLERAGGWSRLPCGRHTSVFSLCWLSFGSLCCHVIVASAVARCVLWVVLVNPGPRGLEDLGTSQLPHDWNLLPSLWSSVPRPQKHLPSHPLSHCCPLSCGTGFVFVSDSLACLSCCLSNVLIFRLPTEFAL